MHVLSFRSLLLLWGIACTFVYALTIPEHHRSNLALRGVKSGNNANLLDVDRRAKKPNTKPPISPPKTSQAVVPPPPPPTSKAVNTPPPPVSSNPPPPPTSSKPPPPPPSSPSPPSSTLVVPPVSSSPPSRSSSSPVTSSSTGISSITYTSSATLSGTSNVPSTVSSVSSSLFSTTSSSVVSSVSSGVSTSPVSSSSVASSSVSGLSVQSSLSISSSASPSSGSLTSSASSSISTSYSSTSVSSSSTVSVDYVRPTSAVNTCDLLGVDCYEDFDEFDGVIDDTQGTNSTAPFANSTLLTKRGTRDFDANIGTGTPLSLTSLDYPGPQYLFKTGTGKSLTPHAYNFTSGALDTFSVKDNGGVSDTTGYVTEHIIELQSVKMFIEAAAGSPGSISLSTQVPGKFFQDWWNTPLDATAYSTRTQPSIKQAPFKAADKTLNNLIFQALGSSYNRADFVLCGAEINSYKERVWSGSNPMDTTKFKQYTNDAATGGMDSNAHLSALRTTLAVYAYFNDATVKSHLQSAIANVKTELSNIKHLTKEDYDLASLWSEFMTKQLDAAKTHGTTWLTSSIDLANTAYKNELNDLQKLQKTLKTDNQLTPAERTARDQKVSKLQADKVPLDKAERAAQRDVDDAESRIAALTAQIEDAVNKKDKTSATSLKSKRDTEKKALERAKTALYQAEKAVNLKQREIQKLYRAVVDKIVAGIQKDLDLLDVYSTATKKISMPAAA